MKAPRAATPRGAFDILCGKSSWRQGCGGVAVNGARSLIEPEVPPQLSVYGLQYPSDLETAELTFVSSR